MASEIRHCRAILPFVALAMVVSLHWRGTALAQSAQQAASQWFAIPNNAVFQTGDTWTVNGQRYRLYGVQSCIRGTAYSAADGSKRDCGDASLAMLTGLVKAWRPFCAAIATNPQDSTSFVICYADTTTPQGSQRVELGTALIASGFAFAALTQEGRPVSFPYLVAEQEAKAARAGLWAFPDTPNPNAVLLNALKSAPTAAQAR
jgi:endonuclease YncB( thermonuclease family)